MSLYDHLMQSKFCIVFQQFIENIPKLGNFSLILSFNLMKYLLLILFLLPLNKWRNSLITSNNGTKNGHDGENVFHCDNIFIIDSK